MTDTASRRNRGQRSQSRSPRHKPSRRRIALESLEPRLALATDLADPFFVPIQDQEVLGGAPLWLGIDGLGADGGPLNYTVAVSNPDLLQASFSPRTNRSLQMDVAGYGQMTFQLFDDLAPRTTQHIESLVNSGLFNDSANLPVQWYRVAHYGNTDFVIQGGPQLVGSSPLGPIDDEYNLDLQFTSPGLLGMGKSNDDTGDASIFVTGSSARYLDFNHSIFGVLTEGESVRQAIQSARAMGDGPPPAAIVITGSRIISDTENAALMLKAAEGASGESDVTLTVTDGSGHSYSQTFHVSVTPDIANSAPFLSDLPATITGGMDAPVKLQLHAIDAEGTPSFFDATRPGSETVPYTLDVNDQTGLVTITPPAGFRGSFQVLVGIRGVATTTTADQFDTQLVTVVIGDQTEPTNHPPTAVNDAVFAYASSGQFVIDVLANDTTAPDEGETLSIVSVTSPTSGGTAVIEDDGGQRILYTPAAGFTGTDSFTYTISDGNGGTATATVMVTVHSAPPSDPHVDLILQLTTPDGTPIDSLAPGQEFVLHVLAQDRSALPLGVFAAYLDVTWDAALAEVTGAIHYSSSFSNGQSGNASTPGLLDEAGSFAGLNELGAGPYEVFSVPMRATAAGALEFSANPADASPLHDVHVYGVDDPVPAADIHFGSVAVTVGAPSRLDVNLDGHITPLDALIVINAINDQIAVGIDDGSLPLLANSIRLDVSRDGKLTAVDALIVINRLNGRTVPSPDDFAPISSAEGEGPAAGAAADQALLALAADETGLATALRRARR